jgi:hypothetical protein
MTPTTSLTVIRAEAEYKVIQGIINPASGRGIMRILTPEQPQRAWRSGAFNTAFVYNNPAWKSIEQKTLEVEDSDLSTLSDAPPAITDRVAKLFPRWGVKASAIALVQDFD